MGAKICPLKMVYNTTRSHAFCDFGCALWNEYVEKCEISLLVKTLCDISDNIKKEEQKLWD